MKPVKKTDPVYTSRKKRGALTGVLAMIAAGLAVFIVGLLLNKMSSRNLFTVVAVLFVLPGAKFLTRLIILLPSRKTDKDDVKRTEALCSGEHSLYSGIVITSPEKVMYLEYLFEGSGNVFVLMAPVKKKKNGKHDNVEELRSYTEGYLKKGVRNWGNAYRVQVFSSKEKFLKALKDMHENEVNKKEEKAVLDYIESVIV